MAPHSRSGFALCMANRSTLAACERRRSRRWKPFAGRPLRGFTLVELLVVVVIISMLAALLLPALIGARGRARIAQCTNNQKEIAKAVQQYELAKKRMPGYMNQLGATVNGVTTSFAVSWVPVLFPYLGRMDLWEDPTNGWRSNPAGASAYVAAQQNRMVNQLVCPDAEDTGVCALTYVVNIGTAYDTVNAADVFVVPTTPPTNPGVFRNMVPMAAGTAVVQPRPLSMTDIRSSSQRPMLSERQDTLPIKKVAQTPRVWNGCSALPAKAKGFLDADLRGASLSPSKLGFWWRKDPTLEPTVVDHTLITAPFVSQAYPNPIHRGIVIVTFCDGHTDSLADNVECNVYDESAIP